MVTQRNTIQRQLVLQAVQAMHNHPTAEEVYSRVAANHPNISRGTVYRNLGLLAQQGAIQRVSHLNAADRFDFELKPHYHFRCRKCDAVFDIDLPYKHKLMQEAQQSTSALVETCEIVFTGICPNCQQQAPG